jgi:hypothetical protein
MREITARRAAVGETDARRNAAQARQPLREAALRIEHDDVQRLRTQPPPQLKSCGHAARPLGLECDALVDPRVVLVEILHRRKRFGFGQHHNPRGRMLLAQQLDEQAAHDHHAEV